MEKHYSKISTTILEKLKVAFLKQLDLMHTNAKLNKSEKVKLSNIICSIVDELIDPNDSYNIKDIYNKYTESDFDQKIAEETQIFKNMISNGLGVDLGDDFEMTSPEEVMAKIFNKMKQEAKQDPELKSKKAVRKKSARTIAKEKRLQDEAIEISQSIKDVYRKLVISLHPDKEFDPAEHERKTLLMQRVNEAYNNNDLLKLLELQLEVEQIDQTLINAMSLDRLKTYNKILREQLNSIRDEIDAVQVGFRMRFNYSPGAWLNISSLLKELQCDIDEMRNEIASLTDDLVRCSEAKDLKIWLKGYKNPPRPAFDDVFWV
jgi:uncharacterized protein (UPF0335 family)